MAEETINLQANQEQVFRDATKRLNDSVPERERAVNVNDAAKSLVDQLTRGRENPQCYQFLRDLWAEEIGKAPGFSMLNIEGMSEPLPIVQVSVDVSDNPINSFLQVGYETRFPNYTKLDQKRKNSPTSMDELVLRVPECRYLTRYKGPTSKQSGFRNDYEGYNACLKSLKFEDGKLILPFPCSMEYYGNIMDSCDALINELHLYFSSDRQAELSRPDEILNNLPWRKTVHNQVRNPIDLFTCGDGRAMGVGMAALTVFNKDGEWVAIRGLRSNKVGTYANTYHVIPSGMTNIDKEDSLANSVLLAGGNYSIELAIEKEFLEEVFSQDFAVRLKEKKTPWPELVEACYEDYLYGKDNENWVEIYITGMVFDLQNYRPEICVLILIKNKKWWEWHNPDGKLPINLSFEWEKQEEKKWAGDKVRFVNIFNDDEVANAMEPHKSVLSGVAAFHLGVNKARSIVKP